MQRFDLIEKLKDAEDKANSLRGDIKAFVVQFVNTHRKFKHGQKVEVLDHNDKSYGIGFVNAAFCGINFKWGFNPNEYMGKEERWLKDLTDIMYEVVKAKKDGTPSTRTLLWDKPREEKQIGRYYLKAIE